MRMIRFGAVAAVIVAFLGMADAASAHGWRHHSHHCGHYHHHHHHR